MTRLRMPGSGNNLKKSRAAVLVIGAIVSSLGVFVSGCYHFSGNTAAADVPSSVDVQKIAIVDSTSANFDSLNNGSAVFRFYEQRQFIPAWWNHKKPSPLADSMFSVIRSIRYYGLLPQHYHIGELTQLFYDSAFEEDFTILRADLLLTDAFISIARDLRSGRLSHLDSVPDGMLIHNDSIAVSLLNGALSRSEIRLSLEQQQSGMPQYIHLRAALAEVLNTSAPGIKSRFLSGEYEDTIPEFSTVRTLEINLDRWRREGNMDGRHILVNIPGCFLQVTEGDSISFSSKVIVGTPRNQTPVLDGLIRSFIIFPYWNVPRSIAVNEILPQIKKDSFYLENHHYEILAQDGTVMDPLTVDWSSLHRNNFPYTVRQKEGVHNALGLVKFWFNNPYAVFLHDTNARLLFNREKRALSHGCVRVEKAMELGRFLLTGNEICSPEDLDQYLEFRRQMPIKITEPIPVYFRYYTCFHRDGKVEFYEDVYQKDEEEFSRVYEHRKKRDAMMLASVAKAEVTGR